MSLGEIQGHRSCPDIHTPPDCYVAKQYISIFPVSPIRCIGCNETNSRHLATEWWICGHSKMLKRSIEQRVLGLTTFRSEGVS